MNELLAHESPEDRGWEWSAEPLDPPPKYVCPWCRRNTVWAHYQEGHDSTEQMACNASGCEWAGHVAEARAAASGAVEYLDPSGTLRRFFQPPITRDDGLTNAEGAVMDALCQATCAYARLPRQHPSEVGEFCDAIHRCQDLLTYRIAQRHHPKGWPIKDSDE